MRLIDYLVTFYGFKLLQFQYLYIHNKIGKLSYLMRHL